MDIPKNISQHIQILDIVNHILRSLPKTLVATIIDYCELRAINHHGSAVSLQEINLLSDVLSTKDCNTRSLTKLSLCYSSMTEECIVSLAKALADNTSLEKLVISQNKIGSYSTRALAAALRDNATLLELRLSYNSDFPLNL